MTWKTNGKHLKLSHPKKRLNTLFSHAKMAGSRTQDPNHISAGPESSLPTMQN